MNILIAPDSFKESADAITVANAIARGVRRAVPDATLDICPMADGGQGTVAAMVAATGGTLQTAEVAGPLYQPVEATFGLLGHKRGNKGDSPLFQTAEKGDSPLTAVIEMAAASGLTLVPPAMRDPTRTTTYGTGQLIIAALNLAVERIIVGIGGSATNDGGAGMAQALGVQFFDQAGQLLPAGLSGGSLDRIARIDISRRDRRLDHVELIAACDVTNPLIGATGASAVYGPQKGATAVMVPLLDDNLSHLASLVECYLGKSIANMAGAGAAGGLGGGLVAFAHASLRRGVELVIEATKLADRLRGVDLCITGEGRLDSQSLYGKTAIGVGRLAREHKVPVIAIVGGASEPGATQAKFECLDDYFVIRPVGMELAEAFARVEELVEQTAERAMRGRVVERRG
jgi:glycerate kinase